MSDHTALTARTVERLLRYVDAECVVHFGSSQRGTATARSDIDLLVIAASDVTVTERRAHLGLLFAHWPMGLDVLWLTPDEARASLAQGNPFLRSVVLMGEPVHGDVLPYRALAEQAGQQQVPS